MNEQQTTDPHVRLWELKPSEILEIAARDTEAAALDPRYMLRGDQWHEPENSANDCEFCAICFAGAVMRRTPRRTSGGTEYTAPDPDEYSNLDQYDGATRRVFRFLDSVRIGWNLYGLECLGHIDVAIQDRRRDMPEFNQANAVEFVAAVRKLAADLKEIGL